MEPAAVNTAVDRCDAVVHLASRVPTREHRDAPDAWTENDRLRSIATRLLVDALLRAPGPGVFVLPTVTMLYQTSPADEQTPTGDVPVHLRSAIVAEQQVQRATDHGKRGIVLRLGLALRPGHRGADPRLNSQRHRARRRRRRRAVSRVDGARRPLQRLRRRRRNQQQAIQGRCGLAPHRGCLSRDGRRPCSGASVQKTSAHAAVMSMSTDRRRVTARRRLVGYRLLHRYQPGISVAGRISARLARRRRQHPSAMSKTGSERSGRMSSTPIGDHALLSDCHSSALVDTCRLRRVAHVPALRQSRGDGPVARRRRWSLVHPAHRASSIHRVATWTARSCSRRRCGPRRARWC